MGKLDDSISGHPTSDLVAVYSRAQALADGELIAAPAELARQAGLTVPVALTRAAWEDCVAWSDQDSADTGAIQDEQGRLWDVLWMGRRAAASAADAPRSRIALYRVPRASHDAEPCPVELALHIGPGDEGEPVITISCPDED